MSLRPPSRSQTSKELADVHGGAFHNNSTMSDSNMPNIEAQSDSSLGDDLAPIAHPCHRDIEPTLLTHHQHLIHPANLESLQENLWSGSREDPRGPGDAGSWSIDCQ